MRGVLFFVLFSVLFFGQSFLINATFPYASALYYLDVV